MTTDALHTFSLGPFDLRRSLRRGLSGPHPANTKVAFERNHGREERRAQPEGLRYKPTSERTGVVFCCNGWSGPSIEDEPSQ
jgi:hypothetical protein